MRKYLLILLITCTTFSCQSQSKNDTIRELSKRIEKINTENSELEIKLEKQEQIIDSYRNKEISNSSNISEHKQFEKRYSLDDETKMGIQILQLGSYHKDEISEGIEKYMWYGLIKEGDKFLLKKIQIKIEPEFDAVSDINGDKTGKVVLTKDLSEPILLINGLENIKEGKVDFVDLKKNFLFPGDNMGIEYKNDWTCFYAYGTVNQRLQIGPYLLYVSTKSTSHQFKQIIAGTKGFDDTVFKFIWAGDIDRDGKLDLIMDTSDHYNVTRISLFLSSLAEEGEIFKLVAVLRSVGC